MKSTLCVTAIGDDIYVHRHVSQRDRIGVNLTEIVWLGLVFTNAVGSGSILRHASHSEPIKYRLVFNCIEAKIQVSRDRLRSHPIGGLEDRSEWSKA